MPEENDLPADDQPDQGVKGGDNAPVVIPAKGDDQPDKDGDEGKGDQAPKGDDKPAADDQGDMEPPVKARKTAKDFIIQRKEAKIAKLQTKLQEKKGEGDDDQGDQGDDESDGDILPADRKAILDTIAPVLQPFIDKSLQAEDETEVAEFITANPEFAPFAAKARKFMSHPSRRNIPIETIFMEAAGGVNGVMKLGAQRLKNITDKAKNGASGGGSSGAGDGKKAWGDMNPGEFEAEKRRVLAENRQ